MSGGHEAATYWCIYNAITGAIGYTIFRDTYNAVECATRQAIRGASYDTVLGIDQDITNKDNWNEY